MKKSTFVFVQFFCAMIGCLVVVMAYQRSHNIAVQAQAGAMSAPAHIVYLIPPNFTWGAITAQTLQAQGATSMIKLRPTILLMC